MLRRLLALVALFMLPALHVAPGSAADCTADEIAKAVNEAGAALRKLSAENTPRLQGKMAQLKTKMKWPEAGYEERAYQALQDERVAGFDNDANALLARIDALGTIEPGATPDCSKLQELQAASLELQATVKTKTAYLVSKLDQMLSEGPVAPVAKAPETPPTASGSKIAAPGPAASPPPSAAPLPPAAGGWSTNTTGAPPSGEVALAPSPSVPAPAA